MQYGLGKAKCTEIEILEFEVLAKTLDGVESFVVGEVQGLYFFEFSQLLDVLEVAVVAVEVFEMGASLYSLEGLDLLVASDYQVGQLCEHSHYLYLPEIALGCFKGLDCVPHFP